MARGFSMASPLLSLSVLLCCCLMLQWKQRGMFHLSESQFIGKRKKAYFHFRDIFTITCSRNDAIIIYTTALMLLKVEEKQRSAHFAANSFRSNKLSESTAPEFRSVC